MAPHVQEMPPPGGYEKIPFVRIPAKTYFSGYTMILGFFGITAGSFYLFYLNRKKIDRQNVEQRSSKIAIYPLLLAERDREFLKQVRRNRDEEEKLMADVEGWEVGTYYGKPLYKTLPPDTFVNPTFQEYYAHSSPWEVDKRADAKLRC